MIRHQNTSSAAKRIAAVFSLLLALSLSALAQPTFTLSYAHLTSLSIGDLDFKTFGSNNWFFTMNITNPDPTHKLRIHGTIGINLADGSINSSAAAILETVPFEVNGTRSISNLNIGGGSDIKTETFHYDDAVKTKLQNQALGTGKLPAGSYTFELWLTEEASAGSESAHQQFVLNLENISRLDLSSPQDNENLTTVFPFFQWNYDGRDVELSVYEMRASDPSTEAALSNTPMLRIKTGDPGFPSGSKSFQYPAASVRPLEVGKTYVWQVKGATVGTGGVGGAINSEIWQFHIVDPTNQSAYSSQSDTSNGLLNRVLTFIPGMTQELLDQFLAGNYQLTGVFMIDGVSVSAADVAAILRKLAANPDLVIEVTLAQ